MGNIAKTDMSCAVHPHKMFRKLLCYFGGLFYYFIMESQQFYSHLLSSVNQIGNNLPKPC